MRIQSICAILLVTLVSFSCKKDKKQEGPKVLPPEQFNFIELKVNGLYSGFTYYGINFNPLIKLAFSTPVDRNSVNSGIKLGDKNGNNIGFTASFEDNDKALVIKPVAALSPITAYKLSVTASLAGTNGMKLPNSFEVNLTTTLDSTDKFPRISDEELLTLVQKQTFKYFWDFGHPVSGLARERNTSGDVVTTGGSGFGIMAIVTAVHRDFISRAEGLARLQQIVDF